MPGAIDISDIVASSGSENMLLMKSQAKLYSSQGVLTGLLALYRDKLMWSEISDRSANMLTIATDVMFGATLSPPGKYKFKSVEAAQTLNREIESSTHFTVYTLTSRENGKRPMCDTWTFMVDSEEESATWLSLLRYAINPKLSEREANVLIFVNPVSGKRKSLKLFQTVVKPILEIGNTAYTLQITESQGFAIEFVKSQDLSKYTAIVAVSGDGLLHEILNGLLSRPDWSKLRSMPLGVIPTGTGNGLAKTLDCFWPEQAAVSIVKAQTRPIDIMSTTLASGYTEYCFLSVTWGLIADIDIESERMRWAGAARLDLYGTLRLMNLRYYGGRLHYLPAAPNSEADENTDAAGSSRTATEMLNSTKTSSLAQSNNQGADMAWGLPAHNFSSPLVRQSPKPLPDTTSPAIQPAVTLHPTLTAGIQLPVKPGSLSSRWRTVEGPFVQVIATNVSWLSGDFLACQKARISDGAIDLVYSGNASKWNLIPYMAAPTRDNYMNTDDIAHVRARAFILEPTGLRTTSRSKGSFKSIQPSPDGLPRPATSRPLSMPLFGSRRFRKSRKSAQLPFRKSTSPQAPVPARVRSQAYTSYHQQTVGQGSSLRIQGLEDTAQTNNTAPQPPAQAIFSVRSETELAAAALNGSGPESSLPSAKAQQPASPEQPKSPISSSSGGSSGPLRVNKSMEYDPPNSMADSGSEGGCQLIGDHGILDLDGEVAELGPIKVECLPSLALIICPPWLNESQTSRVGSIPAPKFAESIRGTLSREGSVLSFNV
ncbi:Sphingosine kinase 1 [Coemansia brasiliensis]|uniref:Sphingosine kinase 1 n=1 Tax=Coemansia brasiliensis TaxID=2650707 RepID=A0A9W8I9E8_9FUNG|nr:Sphingosine kinase 1 [Coemansia brasiliensis]